jgi:hypothetical protein
VFQNVDSVANDDKSTTEIKQVEAKFPLRSSLRKNRGVVDEVFKALDVVLERNGKFVAERYNVLLDSYQLICALGDKAAIEFSSQRSHIQLVGESLEAVGQKFLLNPNVLDKSWKASCNHSAATVDSVGHCCHLGKEFVAADLANHRRANRTQDGIWSWHSLKLGGKGPRIRVECVIVPKLKKIVDIIGVECTAAVKGDLNIVTGRGEKTFWTFLGTLFATQAVASMLSTTHSASTALVAGCDSDGKAADW